LAVRHARLSWWEISLGDRWVITRPRMLPGPRNASRGRRRAKSQRTHARCARQARWAGTDNNCINITHRVPVRFAMPLPMTQIRPARRKTQQPIRRGPLLDRRVTSDAGNREACGDDPRGSFVIFSDVGLFLFRRGAFSRPPARPVWRTQRNCSADRFIEGTIHICFKLCIHSHHAWSAAQAPLLHEVRSAMCAACERRRFRLTCATWSRSSRCQR
jgi:hypothetical protein